MKKMTMMTVMVAMIACLASVAGAEDTVSGDVYAGVYNKYLFRGIDLSGNKAVVQGGADISYKGFSLGYWSNFQTTGRDTAYNSSEITETDIVLSYSFQPTDLLSMSVGNVFYSLEGAADTNELYAKATLNTLLSPSLSVYWDYDEATDAGLFYALTVSHSIEVTKELGVTLGALASYNQKNPSTNAGYSGFHNYELSVGADYAVTDSIKISPSYLYSNGLSRKARVAGVNDQSLFGIKATLAF